MTKSPCVSCGPEEKYEGCHGKCPKYLKWKADYDEIAKKMKQSTHTYSIWSAKVECTYKRIRKPNGRKWGK